ncbi:MAG: MFS transporter [Opitutae bacterium]|nr:MFS transporter [Opitutae bacterium]
MPTSSSTPMPAAPSFSWPKAWNRTRRPAPPNGPRPEMKPHGLQRWLVLAAATALLFCLGGLYAWSIFIPPLRAADHLSMAQCQMIFGTLIAVFTLAMVPAGKWVARGRARESALLGAVLFWLGYQLAHEGSFLALWIGLGLLAGAGTGFGYSAALTTAMRWFPQSRGMATGIVVAGFGGGSAFLSFWVSSRLAAGWNVFEILRWIGHAYGALLFLAALALRPPPAPAASTRAVPLKTALADPFFWRMAAGMFAGTFAGLLVIANLKPMVLAMGADGAWAVSFFAAGNAAGRVAWGRIIDRKGLASIPGSLGALTAGIAGLWLLELWSMPGLALAMALWVGFGFGACFVLYASGIALHWGAEAVPHLYPIVFLLYGLSGIAGPLAGGFLFDWTDTYRAALAISGGVLLLGVWATWKLSRPPVKS